MLLSLMLEIFASTLTVTQWFNFSLEIKQVWKNFYWIIEAVWIFTEMIIR